MAINWDKYKTYDTGKFEYGNPDIWKTIFESIFGEIPEGNFDDSFFKKYNDSFKQKFNGSTGSPTKRNKTKFLSGCKNMQELKSEFRKLMMIHHPDKGGDEETCKGIIAEYEKMSYRFSKVRL